MSIKDWFKKQPKVDPYQEYWKFTDQRKKWEEGIGIRPKTFKVMIPLSKVIKWLKGDK
jgi:hypothetical protein